jgi:hypothetical protein
MNQPGSTCPTKQPPTNRPSGLGSIAAPWQNAAAPPLLQGAFRGARPGPLSDALHPGVIQAAERFAEDAQRRLLASLPADAAARVKVVVSVHTDVEVGCLGGSWVVLIQERSSS